MDFGKAIKEAREQKHMTQEQLAQQMYVTKQAVSKWECGRTTPDLEKAYQLLEILDIRASFEEILYPHSHEMYAVPVDKTFCNLPDIKALCADKGKYPSEIRLSKPAYLLFKHLKSWNPDYQISDLYRSFLLPHTKANPEKKQSTYSIEFNGDDFMKCRRNNGTSYGQNDALTVSNSGAGKTRFSKQSAKKNLRIIGDGWRNVIHPSKERSKGANAEQKDVFLFPNGQLLIDKCGFEFKDVETNEKNCPMIWSQNVRGGEEESVLVMGDPGTGKSRYFVKPNLLQMDGSYVIFDCFGEYLPEFGTMFAKNGYKVKVVNLKDVEHSNHYNPLHYCKNEIDVVRLIDCIIANTRGLSGCSEEKELADIILLLACILYLTEELFDEKDRTFSSLKKIIDNAEGKEIKIKDVYMRQPANLEAFDFFSELPEESNARRFYNDFMQLSFIDRDKVRMFDRDNVVHSCVQRLKMITSESVEKLMYTDDLELEKLQEEKTALFIVGDQTGDDTAWITAMLYMQIFDTLCNEYSPNHIPVHCVLDEFENIGIIPDFSGTLAKLRVHNFSAFIVIQAWSQLKELYGEESEDIADLCGAIVFMGSYNRETLDWVSSWVSCPQLRPDNLGALPYNNCIIIPKHENVISSKKYSLTSHPNYYLTAEADIANLYQFDN